MSVEERLEQLERQVVRYRNSTRVMAILLVAGVAISHVRAQTAEEAAQLIQSAMFKMAAEYSQGFVKCKMLMFVDDADKPVVLVGTEAFGDVHSMSLFDPEEKLFFRVMPGTLNLRHEQRKGGGTFLWAGPGSAILGSAAEFQVVSPDYKYGKGPAVSLNVGLSGAGFIKLSDPAKGTEKTFRP